MNRICILVTLIGYSSVLYAQKDTRTINFPRKTEPVTTLPARKNLWIFILAGQSNMAGRGLVEPSDTLSTSRILTITKDNQWIYAKEPLHFYEPTLAGLDCGLSFGNELIRHLPDSIHIALIPCAVGGSSIQQWLGDSLHRGVSLLSNFKARTDFAMKYGEIKGILWHQGESDAHPELIRPYQEKLINLLALFRGHIQNASLPVLIGELGTFSTEIEIISSCKYINKSIRTVAEQDKNTFVVITSDLKDKGDHTHFDSPSQRMMGKRFAEKFIAIK